jgi:flavin reductase (DIM6/NTAB) family NADH-FMN oxidoreductase RutF
MSEADRGKPWAAALGRVASGLFIVTARHGDLETGMLASWVQQCSFDPPQLTVAVRPDRPLSALLVQGAPLVVNILDDGQTDMIVHFGRGFKPDEHAFAGIDLIRSDRGLPVLAEALAFLECEVTKRLPAGDHDVVVAHILAGRVLNDGHPMVHIRKSGMHY